MNKAPSLQCAICVSIIIKAREALTYYAERRGGAFLEIVDMSQGKSVIVSLITTN